MFKRRLNKFIFANIIGIAIFLVFSSQPTFAEESNFKIKDGEVVNTKTNETYSQAVEVENGKEKKLSLEELKKHLEKREKHQIDKQNNYEKNYKTLAGLVSFYAEYSNGSNYYASGNERKISASINCTGAGSPCPIKSETGWSISESFNVDVGLPEIRSNAGFSWTTSVSRSISYTLSVPVGETKAMYFDPAYNISNGVVTTYTTPGGVKMGEEPVKALSPQITASGEPDGVYFLK